MLGSLMFCSKIIMEVFPNIHLLGMFVISFTLVFRAKALIPIYVNVFLVGLYGGFNLWWMPYLYIWTILWAIAMLIPKRTPRWLLYVICPIICSLHGPVLSENLGYYIDLYDKWSGYLPEEKGVLVAYASIYGNTATAAKTLAKRLAESGVKVVLHDLARCDVHEAVADAFRFDRVVLAASTYNAGVFTPMRELIAHLTERGFKNRTVALIENGSWAPMAAKVMKASLGDGVTYLDRVVKISSSLKEDTLRELDALASELAAL